MPAYTYRLWRIHVVSTHWAISEPSWVKWSPNSTWLFTSRLDTIRLTCRSHAFWLCRVCRTARLDTLVSTHSTRRTCRVETWRDEPSGIWAWLDTHWYDDMPVQMAVTCSINNTDRKQHQRNTAKNPNRTLTLVSSNGDRDALATDTDKYLCQQATLPVDVHIQTQPLNILLNILDTGPKCIYCISTGWFKKRPLQIINKSHSNALVF